MEKEGSQENFIYGLTGETGIDGALSQEQQALLDRIQNEAAQVALNAIEFRKDGQPFPLEAMATGIGKTKIEHIIIENWTRKKPGSKVLFIAGTKQVLVSQSREALEKYQKREEGNGVYAEAESLDEVIEETEYVEESLKIERQDLSQYKVGKFGDKDADVQVATIQTVQSAYKKGKLNPDDFDLVIVDEAHNVGTPTRKPIINSFKNVVGFTATPVRSSGKSKLPQQYGFENIYSLSLPEAQELRLLPPLLGMQIDTSKLVDAIPITPSGQIDFKKLEQILKKSEDLRPYIADKIANIIKSGDKEYKTVIVVNFVWEAEELADLLKNKGIKVGVAVNREAAKVIHSDEIPALDSIDRYKAPAFQPESLQVLISPYVASEGFDAPFTEVLVWASPTDSDLRYTQYTGRLARRAPGKAFGLVIDCIFQTSQYGWNYNFAMWMKENVKQMSNGLLYLGPEQDIENLSNLEAVKNMRQKADIFDASELEGEIIEKFNKETDFSLTRENLTNIFIGNTSKIAPIADKIISQLKQTRVYFIKRKAENNKLIDVIISFEGKQEFVDLMKANGIELRDLTIQEIKETDISLSGQNLTKIFIGDKRYIIPTANKIILELKQSHPEYFIKKRMEGGKPVEVILFDGKQEFIDLMKASGIKLKKLNIEEKKETDFLLTSKNLDSIFVGSEKKNNPIINKIILELEQVHPEYFVVKKRKKGGTIKVIVSNEGAQEFINKVVLEGVKLKKINIQYLKDDLEFSLSGKNLNRIFVGDIDKKIVPMAIKIISELKQSHPEYFVIRKLKVSGQDVEAILLEGKQAFFDAMLKAGFKPKDKSNE